MNESLRGERHDLNVFGVLYGKDGKVKGVQRAENIITTAGDQFYAQRGAGAVPAVLFDYHVMCSAGPAVPAKGDDYSDYTPIVASIKDNDANFPQADNQDADNPGKGAGVVTHKVSYTRADFAAALITHGLISGPAPVGASPILCGYKWPAPFDKTVDDTLVVYVNHQFLGV